MPPTPEWVRNENDCYLVCARSSCLPCRRGLLAVLGKRERAGPMGVVAALMGLVKLPRGRAAAVADVQAVSPALADLPARLRELGFLDGEEVEVLATGLPGGPLAVRVREAECVTVRTIPS